MTPEVFLDGKVTLWAGDCLQVMPLLEENSVDACVCDPPYHLTNNVGTRSPLPGQYTPIGRPKEPKGGFMGKQWDGGDVAFRVETWREVFRVLKPGAHLLSFGGTRTYHRMACAIEDADFEIRDCVMWVYGSGFPKSLDVSKAIDKAVGVLKHRSKQFNHAGGGISPNSQANPQFRSDHPDYTPYEPRSDAAAQWSGFGTALKPAIEPIILARKPLSEKGVAANVLRWGCGALNIDACRVAALDGVTSGGAQGRMPQPEDWGSESRIIRSEPHSNGRWPANLILDGSDEAVGAFPNSDGGGSISNRSSPKTNGIYGAMSGEGERWAGYVDGGSAARFFYTAKADQDDRLGSKHPTVKPLDLIQYLVRLVTPPGGLVLDCFAGTGTTGEAAFREGMRAVLIEREEEYQADIRRRMALALAGPRERVQETVKARGYVSDPGPLFSTSEAVE